MNARNSIPCADRLGGAALALLAAQLLLLPVGEAGAQGIKCWTNLEGVRECGSALPPYAAQEGYERRTVDGLGVEKVGKPQPRDREAEAREAARLAAEAEAQAERDAVRAEQDANLLAFYASEAELVAARDTGLANADRRIATTEANIERTDAELLSLEREAAALERAGSEVAPNTVTSIDEGLALLERLTAALEMGRTERAKLAERFAADLARYRTLKGS